MVMENGFSSPRATDSFPAGLRVLVVDDDPTWLKILEKMLKKCNYDVTTCGLAREALKLLRERKDGYDIVISDVNMPDMDGFKLLEHVGLEMDLPVIMMSVDGETSRVMKGVQHGACDYLLKPIRMKELKNIWQHVFRKRMIEVRDIESYDSIDDIHLFRNAADLADDGHFFSGGDQIFLKKRKDIDKKYGDKDSNDPSSNKKQRVVWSVDLHQKFVKAKYRLYLSRLQKENGLKNACGGLKNLDQSSKDSGEGFGVHNSTSVNIRCVQLPSADAQKQNENGLKGINLSPLMVPRKPLNRDITVSHKATTSSPNMGHSLGSLKPEMSYAPFKCPLASQFAWGGEVEDFEFECKPLQQQEEVLEIPIEFKPQNRLQDCFNNQPTVDIPRQHIQAAACFSPRPSVFNRDNIGFVDSKILSDEISNGLVEQQPFLMGQATGSLLHPETCGLNLEMYTLPDTNQSVSQDCVLGLELGTSNHLLGSELALGSWTDDLGFYPFQGDQFATTSIGFDNMGFPGYNLPGLVNDGSPMCFYGAPRYDFEHSNDSMEYGVVDQGLPIS
ncbi:hypothetical protein V2J09_003822 [Rumex salicifolius]